MVQMNGNQTNNLPIQQKHTFSVSMTLYGTTFTFVLISNFMLIYGFYKTSRPFTTITKLFIYLSVVDIAMTLFKTFYAMQGFLNFKIPCLVVLLVYVLMEFTYIYGLCIFATISFLRYHLSLIHI